MGDDTFKTINAETPFFVSLVAGAVAGTAVDITLFPLDTLKTRYQSPDGFFKAGGFRGLYSGLAPAALGSAPNAALFFCAYDTIKKITLPYLAPEFAFVGHTVAASCAEVAACMIRVPVDVIKMRRQAKFREWSSLQIAKHAIQTDGVLGLYRGFQSSIMRDVPFSIIQCCLWEALRDKWAQIRGLDAPDVTTSSVCGAIAGGTAAMLTTPIDVVKTTIVLSHRRMTITETVKEIISKRGVKGLYAGVIPRTMWISLGGSLFFGVYQATKDAVAYLS